MATRWLISIALTAILGLPGSRVTVADSDTINWPNVPLGTRAETPAAVTGSETDFLVLSLQEKESRSPEQRKIDSRLLYAIYQMRGQTRAKGIPAEEIQLKKDGKGRVLVDIRATVTDKLITSIQRLGGNIVSRSDRYYSILPYVSLAKLETIARFTSVKFIMPAAQARTN